MRKIAPAQVWVFVLLLSVAVVLALVTTAGLLGALPLGDFRGVVLLLAAVVLVYAYAIAVYRVYLSFSPLRPGVIEPGSRAEFGYHVYLLFHLVLFHPLTRGLLVPVPIMRMIYLALGARLGAETYSAGTILDPPLTEVGARSIIGHDAVLFSHVVEGTALSLAPIRIGDDVTIGAKAVIMPGVMIENGAIVAVGAVVPKGTHIGPRELWGGVPARCLRRLDGGGSAERLE